MRSRRSARPVQDKGSALMLCIVFVLLGSLLLVPLLRYTATVIRANGQQRTKINAAEVARGALRTSMATCGYESVKEFQKAEVMVAPALQTEGKVLQKAQGVGMGH